MPILHLNTKLFPNFLKIFKILYEEANADSDGFFTFAQEGWLFSALAFGTLVGSVPLVKLCNWLGFRRVFTLYGMLGACGTVVVPFVIVHVPAPFNFVGMLGIRILEVDF